MLAITVSKLHYPFGWWKRDGSRVWPVHDGPRRLIHVLDVGVITLFAVAERVVHWNPCSQGGDLVMRLSGIPGRPRIGRPRIGIPARKEETW